MPFISIVVKRGNVTNHERFFKKPYHMVGYLIFICCIPPGGRKITGQGHLAEVYLLQHKGMCIRSKQAICHLFFLTRKEKKHVLLSNVMNVLPE